MINLLRMECCQLRQNSAYRGLLLTVCGVSALFAIMSLLQPAHDFAAGNGRDAFFSSIGNGVFICLFLAFLTGKTLGADFGNRTVSLQVACGNSRLRLVLLKTMVFLGAAVPVILLYPLANGIILTAAKGWGEAFHREAALHLLSMTGLHLLAYLWIGAVNACVTFFVRDTGMAMGGSVLYYIFSLVLTEVHMPAIQKASPVYWLATFKSGVASNNAMMEFAGYAALFMLLALLLSCISFRKIDIK